MTVTLTCPECQSKLRIPDQLAAKQIQCPKCSTRFPVPENARSAVTAEVPPSPPQGVTPNVGSEVEVLEEVVEPIRHKREIRRDPTEEAVSTIIPYKNARALIAYYLGVFSLIPCAGLLLGPAAFILGILGLRYVKAHPSAKGTGHAIAGIVLGLLTTLANWGLVLVALIMGGWAALRGNTTTGTLSGPEAVIAADTLAAPEGNPERPLFVGDRDLFFPNHHLNLPAERSRVAALAAGQEIFGLAFSPDGKTLAVATDRNVQLWKVETSRWRTIALIAPGLTFSPDGQHLVVGRYTDRGAALEIYDPETGALKRRLLEMTDKERGGGGGFSPDGSLFVATLDSRINLWDTAMWQKQSIDLKELHEPLFSSAFPPRDSGTLVALTNSRALFFDLRTRKETFSFDAPGIGGANFALTSDGKILASGTFIGDIYLWDIGQRKLIRHVGKHEGAIQRLVFVLEDEILISASSQDATVKVWNMFTERLFTTRQVCRNGVHLNACALSPDGRLLLTGGGDGLIKVWDVASLLDRKPPP